LIDADGNAVRILIVGLNFAPEPIGVGKFTGEMAEWFAGRGHEVEVVAALPYYPWWRHAKEYHYRPWVAETREYNCRVIRCPIYVPKNPNGIRRVLHLASFGLSAFPVTFYRALRCKPDVICAVVPTLFSAPVSLAAARLTGAKAWLHVQDLEIEAGHELGILGRVGLARMALAFERIVLRRFDLVSAISQKMLNAIVRKGVDPARTALFTNWVNLSAIFPLGTPSRYRRELGIAHDRCVVMYSGSMGTKQGLDTVLAAARLLEKDGVQSPLYVFAGEGHARKKLEADAAGLSNVLFMPVVEPELYNEFLNLADIHLLPQKIEAADLVLPSKLCAMLAVGKPVIATALPDTQVAQIVAGAGIIVPPDDPAAFAAAIRALAGDPGRRAAMGKTALATGRDMFGHQLVLSRMESRLAAELNSRVDSRAAI
jgi:colanic acid biosynthesis glycosyl transferase WcaI